MREKLKVQSLKLKRNVVPKKLEDSTKLRGLHLSPHADSRDRSAAESDDCRRARSDDRYCGFRYLKGVAPA